MGHVVKQRKMVITLVKQNDEFSRGLKTTVAETMKNNHQHVSGKDFKIIGNGF